MPVIDFIKRNRRFIFTSFSLILLLSFFLSFFIGPLVFFAVLLLVVLVSLSIRPIWGIYLMVFLLPFTYLVFNILIIRINVVDLAGGITLSCFFLNYIFRRLVKKENINLSFPFGPPFLLFIVSALLSSFFSKNILGDISYAIRVIANFYLVYIFLPVNVIDSRDKFKKVILSFLTIGIVLAGVSIFSFFSQDLTSPFTSFRVRLLNADAQGRLVGYINSAGRGVVELKPYLTEQNLLVEIFLPLFFVALAFRNFFHSPLAKKSLNLLAALILFLTIGTFSRGAWISLFISAILYQGLKYKFQIKKMFPVFALAIFLAMVFGYHMYNLQTNFAIGISSTNSRLLSLEIASASFKAHPFLGIGAGEYINMIGNNIRFTANYGEPVDALGIWQKVAVEQGLLGVFLLVILLLAIARNTYNEIKFFAKKNINHEVYIALLLGFLSVLLFEFVNTSYYSGVWLFLALVIIEARLLIKENEQ